MCFALGIVRNIFIAIGLFICSNYMSHNIQKKQLEYIYNGQYWLALYLIVVL